LLCCSPPLRFLPRASSKRRAPPCTTWGTNLQSRPCSTSSIPCWAPCVAHGSGRFHRQRPGLADAHRDDVSARRSDANRIRHRDRQRQRHHRADLRLHAGARARNRGPERAGNSGNSDTGLTPAPRARSSHASSKLTPLTDVIQSMRFGSQPNWITFPATAGSEEFTAETRATQPRAHRQSDTQPSFEFKRSINSRSRC